MGFLAQETAGTSSITPIKFNNILFQVGSGYSASTGLFTASIAGVYQVNATFTAVGGVGSAVIGQLSKNGSSYQRFGRQTGSSNEVQPQLATVVKLAVGDTLSIQGGGGPLEAGYSYFSAILIATA